MRYSIVEIDFAEENGAYRYDDRTDNMLDVEHVKELDPEHVEGNGFLLSMYEGNFVKQWLLAVMLEETHPYYNAIMFFEATKEVNSITDYEKKLLPLIELEEWAKKTYDRGKYNRKRRMRRLELKKKGAK